MPDSRRIRNAASGKRQKYNGERSRRSYSGGIFALEKWIGGSTRLMGFSDAFPPSLTAAQNYATISSHGNS